MAIAILTLRNVFEQYDEVQIKISVDWICSLTPTVRIENVNAILSVIDKATNTEEVLSDNEIFTFDMAELQTYFEGDIWQVVC